MAGAGWARGKRLRGTGGSGGGSGLSCKRTAARAQTFRPHHATTEKPRAPSPEGWRACAAALLIIPPAAAAGWPVIDHEVR